jgi:hypothetical protein
VSLGREAFFPATVAAALALLAWLYFAQELPLRSGVAFHHMASVRELAKGELPPSHNLVAARTPQAHYGPYLVLLGLIQRVSGADPLVILEGAGLVLLLLFLLAFRALAARLLGQDAARWSAVTTLLLWGPWAGPDMPWIAWGWPGTTSLADTQNFFYPQHAAVVLLLALVAMCLGPRLVGRRLALAVLLSAGLVTTHPLTALAFAAAAAALVASELSLRTAEPRRVATILALPLAGLLVAGLWPYYPVLRLLRALVVPEFRQPLPPLAVRALSSAAQGAAQAEAAAGIDYAALLAPPFHILGPALLGLAWAVVLARRKAPFLLLWSLGALLLALSPLVPLRERLVTFAALPLQLAAAGLCEAAWKCGARSRVALALVLAACALAAAGRIAFVRNLEPINLDFVLRLTPEDAVILADARTSNAIAGLTGRKIVAPEGPDIFLVMENGAWRMQNVFRFLRPTTTTAEREVVLRRWHVTHVLLDRLARVPLRLPYPIVYEGGGYVLYDVRGLLTQTSHGDTEITERETRF